MWVCTKLPTFLKGHQNGLPAVNFSGALVASSREFVRFFLFFFFFFFTSRERAVTGRPVGLFAADLYFSLKPKQQRNLNQSKAVNSTSPQILRIDREGTIDDVKMHDVICDDTIRSHLCKNSVDSDRCIYHISSAYLTCNIKVEYQNMTKMGIYQGDFSL